MSCGENLNVQVQSLEEAVVSVSEEPKVDTLELSENIEKIEGKGLDNKYEIYRVLDFGGKAIISVPEDMKLWSNHDVAVNHVRRYNKIELIQLFTSVGFT